MQHTVPVIHPEFFQSRYPKIEHPEYLYSVLCLVLTGKGDEVAWESFSPAMWTGLERIARAEQVSGLLYWEWKINHPASVPRELLLRLAALFVRDQYRLQSLFDELSKNVLPSLEDLATPVVVLKGGALAQMLYPHPATRPMGDLDLLVLPEGLPGAVERLKELGYANDLHLEGEVISELVDLHHVHLTRRSPHPVDVEVHHTLGQGSSNRHIAPRLDWFWSTLEPLRIDGQQANRNAFMLAPGPLLLHLAVHLALQHGELQMTLLKYYDIHRVIEQWGECVDWEELAVQAERLGWVAPLHAALSSCVERFETPIPAGYLERLQVVIHANAVTEEVRQKALAVSGDGKMQYYAIGTWFTLKRDIPWNKRIGLLWELVMPSAAYMKQRYRPNPSWLWPLYYSVRWVKAAQGFWQMLRLRFR